MEIPQITSLQFLVLDYLVEGQIPGRSLREKLVEHGRQMSGPAFYQFMARLEEARLVRGRYRPKIVAGQTVRERVYSISESGLCAVQEFREFASSHRQIGLQGA